jgi:eukaryotic-like serine/threonine-protein kinase
MILSPGDLIADKYRLVKRFGMGAMGEVWAGERLTDQQPIAIKILLRAAAEHNEVVSRFRREAQVLARVQSEYVARVLDFSSDDRVGLVLIMELIPGESLHAVLAREGQIAIETMLDLCMDVARGLRDLHAASIVHRDLKPGNIVLRPRVGLLPQAVLVDFGMSRILSGPNEDEEITAITRDDRVLGTLEYMAPEQVLGSKKVTGVADLYALGAILYRSISGRHVFGNLEGGPLVATKLNQDAPPLATERTDPVAKKTRDMVARLLARQLRNRYQNVDEVLAEMIAIRAPKRVSAAPSARHKPPVEDDADTGWLPGGRLRAIRDAARAAKPDANSVRVAIPIGDAERADAPKGASPVSLDEPTIPRYDKPGRESSPPRSSSAPQGPPSRVASPNPKAPVRGASGRRSPWLNPALAVAVGAVLGFTVLSFARRDTRVAAWIAAVVPQIQRASVPQPAPSPRGSASAEPLPLVADRSASTPLPQLDQGASSGLLAMSAPPAESASSQPAGSASPMEALSVPPTHVSASQLPPRVYAAVGTGAGAGVLTTSAPSGVAATGLTPQTSASVLPLAADR